MFLSGARRTRREWGVGFRGLGVQGFGVQGLGVYSGLGCCGLVPCIIRGEPPTAPCCKRPRTLLLRRVPSNFV